jgi:15-cis-phytoene synthase
MTPFQYCQDKVLHEGSSLYYTLRVLSPEQRKILLAIHAFFREVNEIPYECQDLSLAQIKLQWWQNEIAQTFKGEAHHPISQVLSEAIHHHLEENYFQEFIEGVQRHLNVTRYATCEELETYCKQTGVISTLLCTQVLGYQNENTLKYAEQLGIALQLTSQLRDIRRDFTKGRLYIPTEDLERFQVTEQVLFNYQFSDAVQALLAYQTTRIRAYYHKAFKYLAKEDTFNQRCGVIRAKLALATLQEIENDGYQIFKHRISLTPLRKLWITWRTNRWAKQF